MSHPLSAFSLTATTDPGEAQAILSRELANLRIKKARDLKQFCFEMNGVHLGQTLLGYNQFATDTRVEPEGAVDMVTLAIGTGTASTFTLDNEDVICSDKGAVVTPSRSIRIHRPAGGGLLIAKAPFEAIERRLWELLDRRPGKPVVFENGIDLGKGFGAQVKHAIGSLVATIERDPNILDNPLLRAGFDDMLLNTLLALPNNFTEELLQESGRTVAPALVRKTEEYIRANLREPITIAHLVSRFSCSQAALFKAYRRYRDYSPMQFLLECRLQAVHAALRSQATVHSVSSIAHSHGFTHLGRFAAHYRKRFGESPSDTLRKTRGA